MRMFQTNTNLIAEYILLSFSSGCDNLTDAMSMQLITLISPEEHLEVYEKL